MLDILSCTNELNKSQITGEMTPLKLNLFKLDMLIMSFKHYFYFALKMTLLLDFVVVTSQV